MESNTLNELVQTHEAISTTGSELEKLNAEIKFLCGFIPKFFSVNGESQAIKDMYRKIEETPDKNVICSNVYTISSIYKEYVSGMIEFINDINQLTVNGNMQLDSYKEKFEKAKENDEKFISALYDGKISPKEDNSVDHAVVNIEYLIDLIPYMESIENRCNKLRESFYTSQSTDKIELLNKCTDLLFTSIRSYCYTTVKTILETYININKVLNEVIENTTKEEKFVLY